MKNVTSQSIHHSISRDSRRTGAMLLKDFSLQNTRGPSSADCHHHLPRVVTSSQSFPAYNSTDSVHTLPMPVPSAPLSTISASETESIRYPSITKQPLLETQVTEAGLDTPHAIFFHAAQKYPKNRCFSIRKINAYVTEVVKMRKGKGVDDGIFIKDHLTQKESVMVGDWEYKTYEETAEVVRDLAAALVMKVDGRLHMFARNSAWWFMLSLAASMSSTPLVTVYTQIGQSILLETLAQTQSVAIFVDSDLLSTLLVTLIECPYVKTILYHPVSTAWKDLEKINVDVENLRKALPGVYVSSIDAFMMFGKVKPDAPTVRVESPNVGLDTKDVIWGVMYPLGGGSQKPKGVLVTSHNMVAGITSMKRLLNATMRKDDTYLSYLPLCFMLEYTLVSAFMCFGLTVGFATKTITYLLPSPYSNLNIHCQGDIESFAPSILFGIPPWWDEIHAHILDIIKGNDQVWQDAFWKAVARKKSWLEHPLGVISSAGIYATGNTSWIRAVRERLFGTRVRWIGVSCAMAGPEKKEFLGLVMSSSGKMVEGFSFMEMSTIVTFMPPNHFCLRTLGFPLPSLEMKLVTVPPQYIATSTPARGEIYIRGPSVPQMVFHTNPEASIAVFLDDGWVKTGDIGEWDIRNPGLRIIDRLKPLAGRFMGEYIPRERIEKAYEASNVANECCLLYSGKKTQPIALISALMPKLREFANFHMPDETPGMAGDGLLLSIRVKALLLQELNIVAKEQGCVDFELVGGIIMTEARLPRVSKPRRTIRAAVVAGERNAADVVAKGDFDRKAIAATYFAEIEVMNWIPISDPDQVLMHRGSMSYYKRSLTPPSIRIETDDFHIPRWKEEFV